MSDTPRDAIRAYKDVIGELTTATDALRERDRRQAKTLERRLAAQAATTADVEVRAALARHAAELQWETVLDALWQESWMTLRPRPRPDSDADPDDLDALVTDVERTAEEVRQAVRRRAFGFGR